MNTGRVLEALMQANPPVIPQLSTNYLAPLVQKERGFRSGKLPMACGNIKHGSFVLQ